MYSFEMNVEAILAITGILVGVFLVSGVKPYEFAKWLVTTPLWIFRFGVSFVKISRVFVGVVMTSGGIWSLFRWTTGEWFPIQESSPDMTGAIFLVFAVIAGLCCMGTACFTAIDAITAIKVKNEN